jgi:hypothetical protein
MSNLAPRTLDRSATDDVAAVRPQPSQRRLPVRCLLCVLVMQSLPACGGGASDGSNDSSSGNNDSSGGNSGPPASAVSQGRFVGTVEIDGVTYFGDAIVTTDGALRLYIGGPDVGGGAIQQEIPASSEQFIGSVTLDANEASGSGVVIGQQCAADNRSRFCGMAVPAEISLAFVSAEPNALAGEVRVTTTAGQETWRLELGAWNNYYVLPSRDRYLTGEYQEDLAEFASGSDVVVSIDDAGRLFFQSARSGCIGNGTVTPHLDGQFNVFDIALTIESCDALYAYLIGEFEGLATTTPSSYWDYDSLLRAWLSKSDPTSPAALTMLGRPL